MRNPGLIKNFQIVGGGRKIGAIKYIEKLCSKLGIKALGDTFDVIVFEDREVKLGYARPDQQVASQIPTQVGAEGLAGRGLQIAGAAEGCTPVRKGRGRQIGSGQIRQGKATDVDVI